MSWIAPASRSSPPRDVGKGTGLGLSQVYGFVKQSGGHVKLYSEPGHGTAVRIYLPRSNRFLPVVEQTSSAAPRNAGGTESILVVDDDADVRDIAISSLGGLGYAVLAAPDGPKALAILRSDVPIDLLFTDVVMPSGMTGVDLARQATALRPALRILLTSGYTAHSLAEAHHLGPHFPLIPKPYRRQDLAYKIRELLDEPR
ncbi:MAG: response regulator [Pseudomonadota bacterium]